MAGLTLTKGSNLSLTKSAPGLTKVHVGLGWDPRTTTGDAFDLDASALLLGEDGKVRSSADFIFYNQPATPDGAVVHQGDNRSGVGDGDDEIVAVDLSTLSADVSRIVFVVSIDQADERRQNFGQVRSAYCRIVNQDNDTEIVRYDLSEDAAPETCMIFSELYRHNGEWKFKAVGQGYASGLAGVAADFGVQLG
ncbi:TerD family protein [Arthrobacter sp. NicSoilB11]|uniref:TerD family protein n=1 Tax=Arthrobacter sp. NicSoilB11 TaxID=2830999 RepID=UPI001CC43A68|nr:TerD family protein [Arthrobacter sp. NicSoilB11]BCW74726.1 chemical-damaging agent resistance protein C [Arthrobacter sp. NicSoilB11]